MFPVPNRSLSPLNTWNIVKTIQATPCIEKSIMLYAFFWVIPRRLNSDAGESPKWKHTTFRTRRKFWKREKSIILPFYVALICRNTADTGRPNVHVLAWQSNEVSLTLRLYRRMLGHFIAPVWLLQTINIQTTEGCTSYDEWQHTGQGAVISFTRSAMHQTQSTW